MSPPGVGQGFVARAAGTVGSVAVVLVGWGASERSRHLASRALSRFRLSLAREPDHDDCRGGGELKNGGSR